jgi:thiol-disulfide isomerase/thioredoxin
MAYLRYVFLSVVLLSGYASPAQVVIRGKINGYDGESKVYYHPTLEGVFAPYWKELKPDGNGSFRIVFKNEGYGNTRVSYKGIVYRFFHDADSEIFFEIKELWKGRGTRRRVAGDKIFAYTDSIKQAITLKIGGEYEPINKFYNRNLRSSHFTTHLVDGTYYSHLISKATTPAGAMQLVDSLSTLEIDQIEHLPWRLNAERPTEEQKDEAIKEFLVNEVQSFYAAVFLNAMFLKRKEHVLKQMSDSTARPDIYNRDWELLIEKLIAEMKTGMKPLPNSPDYTDLLENMSYTVSDYRRYEFSQNPEKTLDQMVVERLFHYDTTLIKDEKSRFAHELKALHLYLNDQLFYSPELLHAVYALQTKYPGSEHLKFFEPKIEKLKASLEASGKAFDDGKLIRAGYQSFDDLMKRFEGKNVLVDIWATWCHPCIEEFKHKDVVKPFFDRGEIELLYISIDKTQWDDRWRQSIKINQLAGHHFRANQKFIEDMWHDIGGEEGVIPRYVLIDKHGKIYKNTAATPGSGSELSTQIQALVSGKTD